MKILLLFVVGLAAYLVGDINGFQAGQKYERDVELLTSRWSLDEWKDRWQK